MVYLLIICTTFTGCWFYFPITGVRSNPVPNDRAIISYIIKICRDDFSIHFSDINTLSAEETKNIRDVKIQYKAENGERKTAAFTLDGYDAKNELGFKFVSKKDMEEWKTRREKGDMEAPDLNDAKSIWEQAVGYTFPVIFIDIPEYWKEDLISRLESEIRSSFDLFVLNNIFRDRLIEGSMIREHINIYSWRYGINFQTEDTPEVRIEYPDKFKNLRWAVFKLDGYDAVNRVGYKFVSRTDIEGWQRRMAAGETDLPNYEYWGDIRKSALNYEFPVIFICMEEYWVGITFDDIFGKINTFLDSRDLYQYVKDAKQTGTPGIIYKYD